MKGREMIERMFYVAVAVVIAVIVTVLAGAVAACVDDHASAVAYVQTGRSKTVWLIVRVRTDYPYEHEWVYADGSDASDDPRAVENQAAYQALKEARKAAGIKRATLTRMIGRLTK